MHVAHGQQRTLHWTLHKHLTVTLQRNVGGGDGWRTRGGMPGDPWPAQDFKEICRVRNDKGGPLPPPRLSASVTHSKLECGGWARFDGHRSLGGGG